MEVLISALTDTTNVKRISILSMLVAMLTVSKLLLSFVPNIEIVTLLFVVYALSLKTTDSVAVATAFVAVEMLIYGFVLWWVLLYLIHWNSLVLLISCLNRYKVPLSMLIGVVWTVWFGVLSTMIEIIFVGDLGIFFWQAFALRYISGVPFFVVHTASNAVVLTLVPSLNELFAKLVRQSGVYSDAIT